ncbi:hypothetical protein M885DRAFT_521330 [Pelagophyceae sp. CCMP2097]|nr:hypothetical protein M885DRAFT_521330 [Pelagophyceae sp. CCMP2097]
MRRSRGWRRRRLLTRLSDLEGPSRGAVRGRLQGPSGNPPIRSASSSSSTQAIRATRASPARRRRGRVVGAFSRPDVRRAGHVRLLRRRAVRVKGRARQRAAGRRGRPRADGVAVRARQHTLFCAGRDARRVRARPVISIQDWRALVARLGTGPALRDDAYFHDRAEQNRPNKRRPGAAGIARALRRLLVPVAQQLADLRRRVHHETVL